MTADYNMALERQAELAKRLAGGYEKTIATLEAAQVDPSRLDAILKRTPLSMQGDDLADVYASIDWRRSLDNTLHALQFGATYACTSQIGAWLETAARSIPDTFALEPSDPPAPEGFFWIAAPCAAEGPCVHAYSWRAQPEHVDMAAFGHLGKGQALTILFEAPWPFGMTISDGLYGNGLVDSAINERVCADNPEMARLGERIARFWSATFVFLQQRVFSISVDPADRHTRHRLERTGVNLDPRVRVIHLRRKIGEPSGEEPYGETVHEWHWQWLVRGHWRNQYFPSQRRNRPVFVQPYVKGPKDKPLKPVATTVYSVDR